ncbi:hypothetical protein ACLI4Y_17715 [Natrialbaceae archaeon A-CW3]
MNQQSPTDSDAMTRADSAEESSGSTAVDAKSDPRGVLTQVRTERRPHVIALALAIAIGLALTWLHWLGLVVGGAFVGLCARRLSFAVAYGVAFGVLVLIVFSITLGGGALRALEMSPAIYLTLAAGIGLPAVGALARGVV